MAFTKNVIRILSLAVVAMAYPVEYEQYPQYVPVQYHHPAPLLKHVEVDKYAHPKYTFKYGVKDEHTGDIKEQSEHRDGDVVKGHYSLVEPDGTTRTVKYTSDKHSGFNAEVIKSGHATHPAPVYKKVIAPVVYHHEHIPQEHAAISYGGHEAQYASLGAFDLHQ